MKPSFFALCCLILIASASGSYCAEWTSCNGPAGRAGKMFLDPHNPAIIYVMVDHKILKSTDGGATWNIIGPSDANISLQAISPQFPGTLYGSVDKDLFTSTDGGANWVHLEEFLGEINVLTIDPQDPYVIYAGTENGIFKSIDGGERWSPLNNGLTHYSIRIISINPKDTSILYAGYSYAYHGRVFKSTNGGENWTPIDGGLPDDEVQTLSIDPQNPAILYASFFSDHLYKSADGGEIWNRFESDGYFGASSLVIDPQDSSILYAGSENGVLKSTDGGATWNAKLIGMGRRTIRDLLINPQDPEMIYASADTVYKSTNGGAAWTGSGLKNPYIRSLAIDPQNPEIIYAGTTEGLFKSYSGCSGFGPAGLNYSSTYVNALAINPQSPATVYAGTTSAIYKSTDGGASWTYRYIGSTVNSLLIDAQTPETLYAGTSSKGVLKSIDGGDNWIEANNGLTNLSTCALAMYRQNPQILYAVARSSVFKSIDGGASWIMTSDGLTGSWACALAIDPENPDIVYAGGSYKSTDGGFNWSAGGLTSARVRAFAISPADTETLYAAADEGFFVSTNGGVTWSNEFDNPPLQALAIVPSMPQTIYVGTAAHGVIVNSTQQTSLPNLTVLNPATAVAGDREFQLSVYGNGFAAESVVLWNGSALTTTFLSSIHLKAVVPADLIASPGTVTITVTSGGDDTNNLNFIISPYSPVTVIINTDPIDFDYSVDGQTYYRGQQSFIWSVGSRHWVAVSQSNSPGFGSTLYTFANWSDGGAPAHFIEAPSAPTTYTASYNTLYRLIKSVSPQEGGSVAAGPAPADENFYASGTSVNILAIANSGYSFVGWSGDLTGITNPQTIIMSAPRNVTAIFDSPSSTVKSITIATNPPGRSFISDGIAYSTSQNFSWAQGSSHTISISSPQGSGGTRYLFTSWSDGGAISHTITVPAEATTYTASFDTQYLLKMDVSPLGAGSISVGPTTPDGYYAGGSTVQISAVPSSGYVFSGWSGDVAGAANPQTMTMTAPRSVTANFRRVSIFPSRTPPRPSRTIPPRRDRKYPRD